MKLLNINLLPADKRKKEQATLINWALLLPIVFIFVAIVGFAFFYLSISMDITAKRAEKEQLANEITKLNSQLEEVSRLENQKAELDRANDVLVSLVKRKISFHKVLDELSKSTPPKIWVSNISITNVGDIKMSGYGLDNEQKQVAALLLNLQNNKVFSDVQLSFSKTAKISTKDVIQFEITAKLVYSEATVDIELPPSVVQAQAQSKTTPVTKPATAINKSKEVKK